MQSRLLFAGLNPVLAGFLTALITAALSEELMKYIFFRLALINNKEVISWLDAILAAIIVGMGFTLLEDLGFAVVGSSNLLRAIFPAHLFFQAVMGYYYGKARVTGKYIYDLLSLTIPVFIAAVISILIVFIAMILMFRQIGLWSKKGEKGMILQSN